MEFWWTVRPGEAVHRRSTSVQLLVLLALAAYLSSSLPPCLGQGSPGSSRQRLKSAAHHLQQEQKGQEATPDLQDAKPGLTKAMEMFNNFRRMLSERMLLASSIGNDLDDSAATKLDQEPEAGLAAKRTMHYENGRRLLPTTNSRHRQRHSRAHGGHTVQQQQQQQQQPAADSQAEQTGGTLSLGEFRINANLHLSSDLDDDEDLTPLEVVPTLNSGPASSSKRQRLKFLEIGRQAERKLQVAVTLAANAYECPRVHGKITQLLCPSRRLHGYRVCIDESALCNGKPDCPYGEDEDAVSCLFYKTTMRYFKTVVDTVVELTDVMFRQRKHLEEL